MTDGRDQKEDEANEALAANIWSFVCAIGFAIAGYCYFGYGGALAGIILGAPLGWLLLYLSIEVIKLVALVVGTLLALAMMGGIAYAMIHF